MQIGFYRLKYRSLEQSLFSLLQKIYEQGKKVVVMTDSEERVESLNTILWTMAQGSFLPHGSARDGYASRQPIWITTLPENPNNASVLILLHSTYAYADERFERVLVMFEEQIESQSAEAQKAWEGYLKKSITPIMWAQNEQGEWHKKDKF